MNRLILWLGLFVVLLAPGRAAKPMAWESLMRVKAAAEQGNPEAQFLLGLQFKEGDGIAKDRVEAMKWLRKSAESGYAEAQYALGDFFAGLDPTDELADPREAEIWLKAAAAQGNADAQLRLNGLPTNGATPVPPPPAKPSGKLEAGALIEEPAVTIHWSESLSGLREAEALLVRGFLLEYGIYVNRDVAAAAIAYRAAAALGDVRGQRWLGSMYAEGRGVALDPVLASAWQRQASGHGSAETLAALKKADSGPLAKDDPAETAKWSLLLSGLRGAEAFLVRGFVLENGIDGPRDLSAAAENYRLAAARGDARGPLRLGQMQAEKPVVARARPEPIVKATTAGAGQESSGAVKNP